MSVTSTKKKNIQHPAEKFVFHFLQDYARFIIDNKLNEFVNELLSLSRSMQLPVMKYFEHLPADEIFQLSIKSNEELLQSIIDGTLQTLLEKRFQSWANNQMPLLSKDQLVSEDITIGSYIRKRAFCKFIPSYTTDVVKAMHIADEIDKYTLKSVS